jgi:hypothetical protein
MHTPAAVRRTWLGRGLTASGLLLVLTTLLCGGEDSGKASHPFRTVLDGVYVHPQADRGAEHFAEYCAKCHNGSDGILLSSDGFFDRWREERLSTLFNFMQTKMPADAPGSLGEWDYLDLVAYILQINGYPEGDQGGDLLPSQLDGILLVGNEGSRPLPAGTPVYAVGCLNHSVNGWGLTSATGPWRSRFLPETDASFKKLGIQPLGSDEVRLQGKFDISGGRDSRVYVRGSITSHDGESGIDVSALRVLNPQCGPPAQK